ncbi:MAG: indole-3-glycerol phosphate synthase TrpC [Bdellovibrionales bacterium]|nr:indole-3-glycerol phosphate synthase TrpC [Bdellovibrionales bacterium]
MAENILKTILAHKEKEVAERRELFPAKLLEKSVYFHESPVSLTKYLAREDRVGVIAEIKRQSPSKGVLNKYISVENLSIGYMQAGASALSVLTDTEFFGGSNEDLREARKFNFCPILRKDFVVDEYQIIEARSIGADVILLIAAALDPQTTQALARKAKELGLEVLLEVHTKQELIEHLCDEVDIVGVNNRDLDTFTVSLDCSLELAGEIPAGIIKISESGIREPEDIVKLRAEGFQGFLIGENFMKTPRPEQACRTFISQVASLLKGANS